MLAELLARGIATEEEAAEYLETLRTNRRMNITLTTADLLAGELGPWA